MESIITFTYCSQWNPTNDRTLYTTIPSSLKKCFGTGTVPEVDLQFQVRRYNDGLGCVWNCSDCEPDSDSVLSKRMLTPGILAEFGKYKKLLFLNTKNW
jgi:hypothetical protein